MCFVNYDARICYINIPKNASSTFRNPAAFDDQLRNFYLSNFIECDYSKYFSFVILRNPVQRFVSAYIEVLSRYNPDREWPIILNNRRFLKISDSIAKFECFIDELGGTYFDQHLQKQIWFLSGFDQKIFKVDFVLEMESLARDWAQLAKRKEIDPEFRLTHKRPCQNPGLKQALLAHIKTNHTIERQLMQLYKEDVELYHNPAALLKEQK